MGRIMALLYGVVSFALFFGAFGNDYVQYKKKVPMIIPTVGKGHDTVKGSGASTDEPLPH